MAALTFPTPTQLKNIGDPTANSDAATKYYVDQQIGSGNSNFANSASTVTSSAQPNITSVGTLISLTVTGNITAGNVNGGNLVTANYFSGDGSLITGINASNAANANYANYAGSAFSVTGSNVTGQVGNALIAGTVYTNAQPNITSVGTLTSLAVTGNTTSGNLIGPLSNGNSNVNIPSSNGNINLTAVGNTILVITGTGANISGTANISGNLSAGNINAGNLLTTNNLSVTTFVTSSLIPNANVTYDLGNATNRWKDLWLSNSTLYFDTNSTMAAGTVTNGNSNISIPAANGNVLISSAGNANIFIVTGTGANVTGTANITGNLSAGNANLGNAVIANFFIGAGNNLSNIQGANVSGQVGNALVAGTVYTNAQPNITSVGSLTGLTVSNVTGVVNFITTANVSLGAVGNLKITGGTVDYVLRTDGAGNLSWVAQSGGGGGGSSISNGSSNVNIATSGGEVTTSVAGNANVLVITGTGANVNGYANITGNVALSGANVSLGAVGNLKITGGTVDYVLRTDGAGNLSWVAQSGGGGGGSSISNGNSNVNIPTANGNINLTAVGNTTMVVTGTGANISGYATITGNVALSGANVSLGAVGNLKITGGTNAYVLSTDGVGNLSWVPQSGGGGGIASTIQEFVATSGQTTFTISGGYTVGSLLVFVNGVSLNSGDYTATSGTNIVLAEARIAGDIVRVIYNLTTPSLVVDAAKNFAVAMSVALGT
jgi:hypothetical protein